MGLDQDHILLHIGSRSISYARLPSLPKIHLHNNDMKTKDNLSTLLSNITPLLLQDSHIHLNEPLVSSREYRKNLFTILYNEYNVASIHPFHALETIPYAIGLSTTLIIDIGYSHISFLAIVQGYALRNGYQEIKGGCGIVIEYIQKTWSLKKENAENLWMHIGLDVKEVWEGNHPSYGTVQVSKKQHEEMKALLIPEFDMEECLQHVLTHSPMDARTALLTQITIIGGGSMLSGVHSYLTTKMNISNNVSFTKSSFPSNMLPWIGGTIYASLSMNTGITFEEFKQMKECPPDWMSIAQENKQSFE